MSGSGRFLTEQQSRGHHLATSVKRSHSPLSILSVALTTFVPALAPLAWSNLAVAAATGFVAGVITSGTLTGGLFGAFSAVLFYGIGQHFDTLASQSGGFFGSGLSTGQFAGKVLSHALAGGIMNRLQGGKFGDGFASAGVTQALSPAIGKVNSSNRGFSPQRVVVAAMVGGTASEVSGGKFANGAVTAAFSRAFNDEATKLEDEEKQLSLKIEAEIKGIIAVSAGDEGLAIAIKNGKTIKIKVDSNGKFSATAGDLTVIGSHAGDRFGSGLGIGPYSVSAVVDESGNIKFTGSVELPQKIDWLKLKFSATRTVNIRNGVFENSGIMGIGARTLRDSTKRYEAIEQCAETDVGC